MDEPESLAGLSLAAREGLDNLIFVVNCNLQRLDGPVRGNGSIVQELEGLFAGAGWNVIKLLWGSDWDPLFARDEDGVLLKRLHETVDGEFQTYAATDGRFNREHFFNKYPELRELIADMSDDDIDRLRRGGHDPVKIHAAYHAAVASQGPAHRDPRQDQEGLRHGHVGPGQDGHPPAEEARRRRRCASSATASRCRCRTRTWRSCASTSRAPDSPEMKYLHARREALGGYLPAREYRRPDSCRAGARASAKRNQSTTMVFVQLLSQLLKDAKLGPRVVPIVADEARTFGMQTLFRQVGIYSAVGQLYEPEDHDELLYYREAKDGQILEEGITEAGALSSWLAAATAYSLARRADAAVLHLLLVFGFQRVGDLIWAAADSRSRGFLRRRHRRAHHARRRGPAAPGRLARTWSRRPSPTAAPTIRASATSSPPSSRTACAACSKSRKTSSTTSRWRTRTTRTRRCRRTRRKASSRACIVRSQAGKAGAAARIGPDPARSDRGRRAAGEGLEHRGRRLERDLVHRAAPRRHAGRARDALRRAAESWVESCLAKPRPGHRGERLRARGRRPDPALRRAQYVALGTDGFGRSDTRAALRDFFEVDAKHIAIAALAALDPSLVASALRRYGLDPVLRPPWQR